VEESTGAGISPAVTATHPPNTAIPKTAVQAAPIATLFILSDRTSGVPDSEGNFIVFISSLSGIWGKTFSFCQLFYQLFQA
jgi:hypothetical protein